MKVLVFLVALIATLNGAPLDEPTDDEAVVLQGNVAFGNHLYQVLAQTDENLAFSPISLHAALSMVYQGAQGTTAEAFAQTLGVAAPRSAALGYHEIIPQINSAEKIELHMADRVYVMEGQKLIDDFSGAMRRDFYSEIEQLDFAQNVEAAETINAWVEEETHGKIKDLVPADSLDEYTRLVLVNALYFKGNWLYQFNTNQTRVDKFYLNDQETIDVDMMHLTLDRSKVARAFGVKEDRQLNARILELPYANEDFSMVIILPDSIEGLAEVEQNLGKIDLAKITEGLEYDTAIVSLPKFKIEQTIDLQDTLTELGLGIIFDESRANFRGMLELRDNENLFVSKILQKVFVEVNEEGAEAAAATEVASGTNSVPKTIHVNHPFIFTILEKSTGNVFFYGRITNPQ